MDNDYRSARGRVNEQRLRRMLEESSSRYAAQKAYAPLNGCCRDSLAMVYSPYQNWQNIKELEAGFCAGTIFSELDKPFLGYRNGGALNG